MYIIGKSIVNREQLLETIKHDRYIEIQLYSEFENFNDCVQDLFNEITSIDEVDVRCVHCPLIKGIDLNIEYVWDQDDYFMLERTVALASMLSVHYGHPVKVIFHTELSRRLYEKIPYLYEAIRNFVQYALNMPGQVDVCIENVIPFKIDKQGDVFFRNGVYDDNIELVKRLREDLATDRVKTVLDTCHMMVTMRTVEKMFVAETDAYNAKSSEDFFKMNAPYIGLIHLADVIGLGTNRMTHGIAFEEERLHVMREFISYYVKYGYDCDITLEIQERNYYNRVALASDYGDLQNICKEYGITVENE